MTNEQLGAFIFSNFVVIVVAMTWVVRRAIEYTHLQRDVKELQDFEKSQEIKNEKVQQDLKGISTKIDKKSPENKS